MVTKRAGGSRSGQAMIFAVLSLTFMFSVLGLAIDLGNAYYLKQRVRQPPTPGRRLPQSTP